MLNHATLTLVSEQVSFTRLMKSDSFASRLKIKQIWQCLMKPVVCVLKVDALCFFIIGRDNQYID